MIYPEGNPGSWPVDLLSDVGRFRALTGDLNAEPYDPDHPGFRTFEKFSDSEIESYLEQAQGSIPRAIGFAYLYLAGQAAIASKEVRDYDLLVNTTKRSTDLRTIAQIWFDRADTEDVSSAEEGFEIVSTGTTGGEFIPELTPAIFGRQYTIGRWR